MVKEEIVPNGVYLYLFNFAIIMHSWQGHHNSMVPITVGPLI